MHDSRRFQVLSLDGGGVRGIFVAAILAGLEEDLGYPIADRFDLIVGTSTGGIIALGLAAGIPARELVEFYVSRKAAVFPRGLRPRWARGLWRAKYTPEPLERALREVLGDRLLGASTVPLVIPSYDIGENTVHLFKTSHHERLRRDHKIPMWQVGMATAAAPTFFPTYALPGQRSRLVDGGVWANNPVMVGVAEAVSMFGCSLDALRVLSIGTTTELTSRGRHLDNAGLLRWARRPGAVDLLMRGQSIGAFTQAQHLVGLDRVHRLDPIVPDQAALDRCEADELIARASHHSRVFSPTFVSTFGDHSPRPYTPFHGVNSAGATPCS
jgi:patatin-like phospholipase/acyl hydrolase